MDKRHILLNTFVTVASVALIISALSISRSPYSNNFHAEANRGSKTLEVTSVNETTMTLSNGWSPRITTSNISFEDGLFTLNSGGYIQNVDAFQAIRVVTIRFDGNLILGIAEYDEPSFREEVMVSNAPYDVDEELGEPFQYFKIRVTSDTIIYSITLEVTCS